VIFLNGITLKEDNRGNWKNFILCVITTMVILYISVPTYGIIRDLVAEGEVVFVLDSSLPDAQMNRPGNGIIERIYNWLFPSREVPVPILQRIDIRGRVVYTDKTPYANGIVELRSEPRYTRTDDSGYFVFLNVLEGDHTINILSENGAVLVKSCITIERIASSNENIELLQTPGCNIIFRVAVDIDVLEITLHLEKGSEGNVTGLDKLELGLAPDIEPEKPLIPGEPADPAYPPGNTEEDPEKSPETPDSDSSGGESKPGNFEFDVRDTASEEQYGSGSAVNVNIFGDKKRIAPGMKGSYQFTVDNRGSDYDSFYNVGFTAIDTLPAGMKIPMLYRLKADEVYLVGDNATWCAPEKLKQKKVKLDKGRQAKYTLEWYWPEGKNDNDYALFGGNAEYYYQLIIKVTANAQY